ncbi:isochorismatase family cysteine hydrolase [Clostridium boliviensis]|uniref:nicotinamidase n=1 Tax=Clostridium boliviensis TaxID=318465 RepID=A0ABU4GL10_9CLOT|nr:isochorismatase family cysteine hydrolase [Clostridium boliviensis]MDW2796947.1 isochorismatase family cysteine hydrolase [Clostridium boliviensis]
MSRLLVVVDMQKDFIDGSLGTREAEAIVNNVKKKIEEYQAAGEDVIFTLDTHENHYMDTQEGKNLPVLHCVKGTAGWELADALKEIPGRRFEKNTFASKAAGEYAASGSYESIELIGLCTDICVISNALLIKAFLPETPVLVDSSCCAGVTPESHENALKAMKMCQVTIL